LVGGGDPVLTTADVDDGISALARRGVRRIRGDLLIDATAYTGPDYNAHWTAAERVRPYAPGTSAVSIDEGVSAGAAVLDPQAFAGAVVRRQLLAHDITVDGVTRFGHADGGTVVWTHASSPLSALVSTMLRQSDNHIAEQLVREVGRASTGVGSEDAGLARMHDELTGRGISTDGLRLDDGSGLSLDNRMTPRTLAMLLASIARTPVGTQIYHALPRVGTGGDVVAKTGWVGEDEGLAGYLDHPPDGSYAFAFLGTGALGTSVSTLQAAQERQLQRYR
jgi:D-alanyl-D-alanine carboxypeptidase/D-alanyl-D-alanine-endopeptidase (penicillin-binding protein 4)